MFLSHGILVRITFSLLAIATLYNFYYVFANYLCHSGSHEGFFASVLYPSMSQGHESLVWNEKQCEAAFPLLTKEIDDSVSGGPFQFNRSVDSYTGQVHGRIKDGKVREITRAKAYHRALTFGELEALYHFCRRSSFPRYAQRESGGL
jgi:hypothetical protein